MIDMNKVPDNNFHRAIALQGMVTVIDAILTATEENQFTTVAQVIGETHNLLEKIEELINE